MRVYIADRLSKVRSAFRLLIEQDLDGVVVGEASCSLDLMRDIRACSPELLILDWDLPGLAVDGNDRIAPLRKAIPDCQVLAVQSQGSANGSGKIHKADAVIRKGDSPERVLEVLRALHQNGTEGRDQVPQGE